MLRVRDMVELAGPPMRRIAVVCVLDADRVATIDVVDPVAWPEIRDVREIVGAIDRDEARLLDAPMPRAALRTALSEAEINARDLRWKVVGPLVAMVPEIFDPSRRGGLVTAAATGDASAKSIRRWLRAFWQGGMSPMALVGSWDRCGARGVEREPGRVKLGRPRTRGSKPGINLSAELRRLARSIVWAYYRKNRKLTLSRAYDEFCRQAFYVERHVEGEIRSQFEVRPEFRESGYVSEPQFRALVRPYVASLGIERQRRGPKQWDATRRGLPSTATAEAMGPGSRYAIDATILDVYVRSRVDPQRIVGRAVLYCVRDVWSRLIVGVYVGVGNASWACAMMALANVVEDKVQFCARHGIRIEPHEWPNSSLSERILTDGGEMTSRCGDQLARYFNCTVETASSWRGDLKGVVENLFEVLPADFAPYTPGYIEPDFRQRGGRDYRAESVLDVEDVTQQVLLAVIRRNNDVPLAGYDREPGMPAAKVAPYPVDLWSWGVANRTGTSVSWPDEYVRFRLMPEADAVVDEHGLRFLDAWYLSDGMLERGWLERGRAKPFGVRISHDPRSARRVYLHFDGTEFGFEVCPLSPRSRRFDVEELEPSFWDVGAELDDLADVLADAGERAQASRLATTAAVGRIVQRAQARSGPQPRSDRRMVHEIRQNRSYETEIQKALDAQAFAPADPARPPSAPVAKPVPRDEPDVDLSIDELME